MIKVLLKGPALSRSGYGEHARFIFRALESRPDLFDLYIHPTTWGQSSWNINSSEENLRIQSHVNKLHQFSGKFDLSFQVMIPSEFQQIADKNIGVTAGIETTEASAQWINCCNHMDHIIVTSEHSKKSLATPSHVVEIPEEQRTAQNGNFDSVIIKLQKPTTVISYPFRELKEDESCHNKINLDTKFNFLTSAQVGPRKNILNTIKWFVEEFKDEEDVGLVVKAHHMNNSILDRNKVKVILSQSVHGVPNRKCRVFLVHGNMTDEEMNSLYTHPNIHAYVTATHGEGFGLPIFEAACNGMPVVAPAWSGQVDFLYDDTINEVSGRTKRTPMFEKVKYELQEVPDEAIWENVIDKGSKWCYPDEASYKKALRRTKTSYKSRKAQADNLQASLRDRLQQDKMFEKVVTVATSICPEDMVELEGFLSGLTEGVETHE